MVRNMFTGTIDLVTIALSAFAAISLIVSTLMIGIITYVSVLERRKEIGILRAVGARKRDISRVFNAEASIIGLTAGLIGVFMASLFIVPLNMIVNRMIGLPGVAYLSLPVAALLILGSIALTLIAGFIPSRMAAKKDPVEALRME
jgi:putative ABC transport system permease protein